MTELYTWLAREARRRRGRASLPAALLLGRGLAYAYARLGPVWLGLALRTGLHAAEWYLLSMAVPYEYLAPLFGYRTLVSMVSTAHWGALEPLRHAVREHVQTRQLRAARERIDFALGAALCLGSAPLLLCSLYLARELLLGDGLSLFDAYAWACALRVAVEAYARTYHAGVYASRRVYRALWSFAAGDVLSLTVIVVGWNALGAFCVPLALAASALLDAALCFRAATAAYRLARMSAPRPRVRWLRGEASLRAARDACLPGLANLSLQLDGLLLLALVALEPTRALNASFVAFYYVLRPALSVSSQWVRVFYFDLSRLESGALRALRGHLRKYLNRVGLACAGSVALVTLLAAGSFGPDVSTTEVASLIALALARASFAPVQLEAFVQRRYGLLVCTTLAFAGLLHVAVWLEPSQAQLVAVAALALGLGARMLPAPLSAHARTSGACSLPEWLQRVRGDDHAQLAVLRVARAGVPVRRVIEALARTDPSWSVAQLGRSHLLLLSTAERTLTRLQLVAATGGLLESAEWSALGPASTLLERAQAQGLLPAELSAALARDHAPEALHEDFARSIPTGRLLDLHRGTGQLRGLGLSASQLSELTALLVQACTRPEQPARRSRLPLQLAVFAPGGAARWLFVAPKGAHGFAALRARVRAATWRASAFSGLDARVQHDGDAARARSRVRVVRSVQRRLGTHDA